MEEMEEKQTIGEIVYCVPLAWAGTLITRARKEKRINSDHDVVKLMDQLVKTREYLGTLLLYDWVNVPLVYTQVKRQHYKKS